MKLDCVLTTCIFVKKSDTRIIIEYLESINFILKAEIVYYEDVATICPQTKNVIFVRIFPEKVNWPSGKVNVFLLNTEQITAHNYIADVKNMILQFWSTNSSKILNKPTLLDYSEDNIRHMVDYNFEKIHLPYIIREEEKLKLKLYTEQDKIYDAVIVGWLTERRIDMVNKLTNMGFKILALNMNAWVNTETR